MTEFEERIVIYIALGVVCAFIGVFAGLPAAGLTYLQIAAVIEAVYWFGIPRPVILRHRRQRILFNR